MPAALFDLDHTMLHLTRLDLLVRREVIRLRLQTGMRPDEDFRGLYVSDEEVDRLLDGTSPATGLLARPLPGGALQALDRAVALLDERISAAEDQAAHQSAPPRLSALARLFGLSAFECRVLVLCLAAEMDLKYERLFAYLQDDVTKKRPTVDLAMRLLCADVEARMAARSAFAAESPLLRWDLVTLHDDPGARRPVLLARYLKLDERIAGYLLGSDELDSRLRRLLFPSDAGSAPPCPNDIRQQLLRWARAWPQAWRQTPPVILLHGRYGSGKRAATGVLAQALGRPLLLLSAADLAASELPIEQGLRLADREALLTGALLCWAESDSLLHADVNTESEHRALMRALALGHVPTVLLAAKPWEPGRELAGRPFLRLELPEPTYGERRQRWAAELDGSIPSLTDADMTALAGRYRLTPGQIHDALARAQTLAWARDPADGRLQAADIDAACRGQAQHRLSTLAHKIEPHYGWDDIVLPRAQLATLRLMCTTVRQRPTVYGDWGFERKLSLGKGVIALFAGPSGTGKTMAAEIIARELGLDLYKVDLAAVVSKYIGETEKNLERIFGEAQDSDAILFFDEADALFGRRSEVKDAHDRYANIETAYLLQRTEEYNGLVILASNIKKNIDEAFVRRLHFVVDFPFPEEAERLEIWRRTVPAEAPLAADIDLPFLARKLKTTGGNIRNIILMAAFLAAEEKQPIAMRHLVRGASYEFQKMGKLVVEGDFERYFELIRA